MDSTGGKEGKKKDEIKRGGEEERREKEEESVSRRPRAIFHQFFFPTSLGYVTGFLSTMRLHVHVCTARILGGKMVVGPQGGQPVFSRHFSLSLSLSRSRSLERSAM